MVSADNIGFTCTYVIMVLTNLIGNTLVIVVVLRNRPMHIPMNFLLVNLAFSDVIVAVSITVQYIFVPMFTHPDGTNGAILCKFLTGGTLLWTAAVCSAFNLVAISFERYYAIMSPLSLHRRISSRVVKYIIAATWVMSIVINIPLFLTLTYDYGICVEKWPSTLMAKAYTLFLIITIGAVPIILMSYMYSKIVKKLWFDNKSSVQQAVLKARKKVTQMVIAVSVIYVVCWIPGLVMYFLFYELSTWDSHLDMVLQITTILAAFNSSINPFIYSLQSKAFRDYLCGIINCQKRCHRGRVQPENNSQTVLRLRTQDASVGT